MEVSKEKNVTVQGLGNPVPAAAGSDQAGSQSSRSNDCGATAVAHLAAVTYRDTSNNEKIMDKVSENPFRRSTTIGRSPPVSSNTTETIPQQNIDNDLETTSRMSLNEAVAKKNISKGGVVSLTPKVLKETPRVRDRFFSLRDSNPEKLNKDILVQWNQLKMEETKEETILEVLVKTLNSMNEIISKAKNIHKSARDDMSIAMNQLKRLQATRNYLNDNKNTFGRMLEDSFKREEVRKEPSLLKFQSETDAAVGQKRKPGTPPKTPANKKKHRQLTTLPTTSNEVDNEQLKRPEENGFETVHRKTVRRKLAKDTQMTENENRIPTKRRRKPDAIKLVASEETTYADILKHMKTTINPSDTGTEVRSLRKTRKGELLIVLKNDDKIHAFRDAVAEALKDKAAVHTLTRYKKIEVKDMDETVDVSEVEEAFKTALLLEKMSSSVECRLYGGFNGSKTAIVRISEKAADVFLKFGRIKIGWVNCRVRETVSVIRCFRCLRYGHIETNCKGPDRKKYCLRCGCEGHQIKSCTTEPECMICKESNKTTNHLLGTSKCESFKEELKRIKQPL